MFCFLACVPTNHSSPSPIQHRVEHAAKLSLGFVEGLHAQHWRSATGKARLWTWTNEPPGSPLTGECISDSDSAVVRLGGIVADREDLLRHAKRSLDDLASYAYDKSGDYSLCSVTPDAIGALITITRQYPLYYSRFEDWLIVSNRALLAHLIGFPRGPQYNMRALVACFANLWNDAGFLTDEAPFQKVALMPPNSMLMTGADGFVLREIDDLYRRYGMNDGVPDKGYYRDLGELFAASLRPLAKLDHPLTVGLTGGKDSRLLCAALKHAEVPFEAATSGFDTDPDVVIGKQLAAFYGVKHIQAVPSVKEQDDVVTAEADARGNIARQLLVTDGMIFQSPRLGPRNNANATTGERFSNGFFLSTKGAELWRAGYAGWDYRWLAYESVNDLTEEQMQQATHEHWGANNEYLKPEWSAAHTDYIEAWLAASGIERQPSAAPEKFFLTFEVGRRDAAWLQLAQMRSRGHQPFLEQVVIRKANEVGVAYRADDYLHYHVIAALCPGAEKFPLDGKRWNFERNGPLDPRDRAAWEARAPLPVTHQSRGFWPMCIAIGSDYWRQLYDEFFCYDDGNNIWSFLDRERLLRAFHSEELLDGRTPWILWNAYGLSVLMSNQWLSGAIPERLIEARITRPWPDVYRTVVEAIRTAQTRASQSLQHGLAAWLRMLVASEDPIAEMAAALPDVKEDRRIAYASEDMAAVLPETATKIADRRPELHRVWGAANPGRDILARAAPVADGTEWHVTVECEPGSEDSVASYLVLSLDDLIEPGQTIDVHFECCGSAGVGACWILHADDEAQGPIIRYRDDWQPLRFQFAIPQPDAAARNPTVMRVMIGLPDRGGEAKFRGMTVTVVSASSDFWQVLSGALKTLEADTAAAFAAATEQFQLTEREAEELRSRSGISREPFRLPDEYDAQRFLFWLHETTGRRLETGRDERSDDNYAALAREIIGHGGRAWAFLAPFGSLADRVCHSLMQAEEREP